MNYVVVYFPLLDYFHNLNHNSYLNSLIMDNYLSLIVFIMLSLFFPILHIIPSRMLQVQKNHILV